MPMDKKEQVDEKLRFGDFFAQSCLIMDHNINLVE